MFVASFDASTLSECHQLFCGAMASETASAGAGVDGYEAEASEAEEERLESGTLRFTVVAPDGAKLPIEVAVIPLNLN